MCLFLQSAFQCIIIDKTINIESVWAEEAGKRLPRTTVAPGMIIFVYVIII